MISSNWTQKKYVAKTLQEHFNMSEMIVDVKVTTQKAALSKLYLYKKSIILNKPTANVPTVWQRHKSLRVSLHSRRSAVMWTDATSWYGRWGGMRQWEDASVWIRQLTSLLLTVPPNSKLWTTWHHIRVIPYVFCCLDRLASVSITVWFWFSRLSFTLLCVSLSLAHCSKHWPIAISLCRKIIFSFKKMFIYCTQEGE